MCIFRHFKLFDELLAGHTRLPKMATHAYMCLVRWDVLGPNLDCSVRGLPRPTRSNNISEHLIVLDLSVPSVIMDNTPLNQSREQPTCKIVTGTRIPISSQSTLIPFFNAMRPTLLLWGVQSRFEDKTTALGASAATALDSVGNSEGSTSPDLGEKRRMTGRILREEATETRRLDIRDLSRDGRVAPEEDMVVLSTCLDGAGTDLDGIRGVF